MGKVSAGATMSLDGFIAGSEDSGFDLLFKWYGAGDVAVPVPTGSMPPVRVAAPSAKLLRQEQAGWGALVVGRHLYDLTNGWGGRHPLDMTTVVVTHRRHPPPLPRDQVAAVVRYLR